MNWVVVVEQWDEAPFVVPFDSRINAELFVKVLNEITEGFPEFHYYAREPQQTKSPLLVINGAINFHNGVFSDEEKQAQSEISKQALQWAKERMARRAERR